MAIAAAAPRGVEPSIHLHWTTPVAESNFDGPPPMKQSA
jgi:hypothetical protein